MWSRIFGIVLAAATLAYPAVVYLGMESRNLHWVAVSLVAMAVLRALTSRGWVWVAVALGAMTLALGSTLSQSWMPLKLYPVLVNLVLLAVFGLSLISGPPVIESLARLTEPELPATAIPYTRKVTQVWCGFFVINASLAAATALWASDAVWALYNGLLAYGLMGLLFSAEWLMRRRVRYRDALDAAHG
ncbi:hypothetical protein [Rhodoferax sp.]|uniref:COG4648 family protein n=1 Tax=Rhodoferax sp. TaxID=50421 RepID=UPI0019EFBF9D|nr:hypothetical protein [Rhodoferax sp.]MBE0474781.1 hypothetical protein [Rhodoferax sp.]